MKLKKDNAIRELVNEEEIKIFKSAGWEEVIESKTEPKKTEVKKNTLK